MNSVDTIKFVIPGASQFLRMNTDYWQAGMRKDKTFVEVGIKEFGIASAIYQDQIDECVIELSSKIMGVDYFNGISLNSFDNLKDKLSKLKAFQLTGQWQDVAIVRRVDVCKNIKPTSLEKTIQALNSLRMNSRYRVQILPATGNPSTVIFHGIAESNRTYFKFYDKQKELLRATNKEFMMANGGYKFVDQFNGILRCETKLYRTEIKEQMKPKIMSITKEPMLISTLESKENVLMKQFDKIKKPQVKFFSDPILDDPELSANDAIDEIGFLGIIERYKSDMNAIDAWLKEKKDMQSSSSFYRMRNKFKERILNQENRKCSFQALERLDEIEQLLQVAA